jgi:hypothetical protein
LPIIHAVLYQVVHGLHRRKRTRTSDTIEDGEAHEGARIAEDEEEADHQDYEDMLMSVDGEEN